MVEGVMVGSTVGIRNQQGKIENFTIYKDHLVLSYECDWMLLVSW